MSGVYIPNIEFPKDGVVILVLAPDGLVTVYSRDRIPRYNKSAIPVLEHGPLVDALEVINTFPEEFIFTNEQARALTNYIIPADPAEEE